MPRGRVSVLNKVVATPPAPTSPELVIAEYLTQICGIPGCIPRLHMEDATTLIKILGNSGLVIKKG